MDHGHVKCLGCGERYSQNAAVYGVRSESLTVKDRETHTHLVRGANGQVNVVLPMGVKRVKRTRFWKTQRGWFCIPCSLQGSRFNASDAEKRPAFKHATIPHTPNAAPVT